MVSLFTVLVDLIRGGPGVGVGGVAPRRRLRGPEPEGRSGVRVALVHHGRPRLPRQHLHALPVPDATRTSPLLQEHIAHD